MPTQYKIIIEGHLDPSWSEWLEGMTVTLLDTGETLLTGPVTDQSALHGLLARLLGLNLILVSVNRIEPELSPGHSP